MDDARHIACSLTSTLLQRVRRSSGDADAVRRVIEQAGSPHSEDYLQDVTNWISYEEATALFAAAVDVTGDPGIARAAGEEAVRRHAGTPVATLLRSLGSPERILEQVTTTVSKFSVVTEMETIEVAPGRSVVRARAREGFTRDEHLCEWTSGLLSQATVLFGLPAAEVVETECQARGGACCLYTVDWDAAHAAGAADPEQHLTALEAQLAAMGERVENILATAADLISHDDLETALARITARAATAVRAPRYLLAVRPTDGAELHCHQSGLSEDEAQGIAERLDDRSVPDPPGWLVAEVRSASRDYGRLAALHDENATFFAQERELFAVYARFAATVLDRANALDDAKRRHREADALLRLSRALASAGGSDEVAERLADAVPAVVDCDRVAVLLWDEAAGELCVNAGSDDELLEVRVRPEDTPALGALIAASGDEHVFFDTDSDDPFLRGLLETFDDVACLVVPVRAHGTFLGVLSLSASERPERVRPTPELLNRLTGVVAQAATALENGRLIDAIRHQALHDGLTALPNRDLFGRRVEEAVDAAEAGGTPVALFYVDVDRFKSVNDAFGHAAGDELLKQVADRLASTVRTGDTVARLGGDEFAVLLAGGPAPPEIEAVSARIVAAFETPFDVEGHSLRVEASVGRAVWPADAREVEALLRSADAAMYRVKRDRAAAQLLR
jgi:diguanylate cyclase (GGDEF)-like protein